MDGREVYSFFDEAGDPLAVFFAKDVNEATTLFEKLYRDPEIRPGYTVCKESEVSPETWDAIHKRKMDAMPACCVALQPAFEVGEAKALMHGRESDRSFLVSSLYLPRKIMLE